MAPHSSEQSASEHMAEPMIEPTIDPTPESQAVRPKAPIVEPDPLAAMERAQTSIDAKAQAKAQAKAEAKAARAAKAAQQAEAKAARKAQKQAERQVAKTAQRAARAQRAADGLRFAFAKKMFRGMTSAPAMFFFATIIVPGLLLGARQTIVANLPVTAKAYAAIGMPVNLDGLDLRGVSSVMKTEDGGRFLLIRGEIVNLRERTGNLPNLQLALRGPDGRAMYTWQAPSPTRTIKARDSIRFVARLDSPPEGAKDVVVEFARKGG